MTLLWGRREIYIFEVVLPRTSNNQFVFGHLDILTQAQQTIDKQTFLLQNKFQNYLFLKVSIIIAVYHKNVSCNSCPVYTCWLLPENTVSVLRQLQNSTFCSIL